MSVADVCARCAAVCFERNPVVARMLGLCPLLAVVDDVRDGLLFGAFFVAVLAATSLLACLTRHLVARALRLLWLQLLAATCTGLFAALALVGAYAEMAPYGVYLGLIAANCLLLEYAQGRAQSLALPALLRDLPVTGGAVWAGVLAYGALRGALGGGDAADGPLPLLAAPAGALILLGLLAAGANALAGRRRASAPAAAAGQGAPSSGEAAP